jgi:hypothetical protein
MLGRGTGCKQMHLQTITSWLRAGCQETATTATITSLPIPNADPMGWKVDKTRRVRCGDVRDHSLLVGTLQEDDAARVYLCWAVGDFLEESVRVLLGASCTVWKPGQVTADLL